MGAATSTCYASASCAQTPRDHRPASPNLRESPFYNIENNLVFAAAFGLPSVSSQILFRSELIAGLGAAWRLAGILLIVWSLLSFGTSFRVGIDSEHPDRFVTTGAFALTRNPIYVAFALVLVGEFLIFPDWILLLYIPAGVSLFHRQVLREEDFLQKHYGREYLEYCRHSSAPEMR